MKTGAYLRLTFQWQKRFPILLSLILIIILPYIIFDIFSKSPPACQVPSIENAISRGNRIIAVEASDKPHYRWVFDTPEDYTIVDDNSQRAEHVPAQIAYGPGWTPTCRRPDDTVYTHLTDDEWQLVEQWKKAWCKEGPALWPMKSDDTFYTLALRCTGYDATMFQVPKDRMPKDIATLLRRSS